MERGSKRITTRRTQWCRAGQSTQGLHPRGEIVAKEVGRCGEGRVQTSYSSTVIKEILEMGGARKACTAGRGLEIQRPGEKRASRHRLQGGGKCPWKEKKKTDISPRGKKGDGELYVRP